MSNTEIAIIPENGLTPAQFNKQHLGLAKFIKDQLREAKGYKDNNGYDKITAGDYGIIPKTNKKSLLKPGAEKLLKLFGFSAHMELVKEVEDFNGGFVMYKYRCTITHTATGKYISDAVRSCNNKESKHAKKDIYDVANTVESIAQKRALVAATVQATMASEIFDADVSEYEEEGPREKVTKEEDPRRAKIMMHLHVTAENYGWNEKWLHASIKKKYGYDSLTECSNQQLEELKENIEANYIEVEKGEKPQLRQVEKSMVEDEKIEAINGEVEEVETPSVYFCKGSKHHVEDKSQEIENTMVQTTTDNPWCSDECREEYYPTKKEPVKEFKFNTQSREGK